LIGGRSSLGRDYEPIENKRSNTGRYAQNKSKGYRGKKAVQVDTSDVCYLCSTNKQRNIVSDSVFEKVVQGNCTGLEGYTLSLKVKFAIRNSSNSQPTFTS
jgi:hypothetical protein